MGWFDDNGFLEGEITPGGGYPTSSAGPAGTGRYDPSSTLGLPPGAATAGQNIPMGQPIGPNPWGIPPDYIKMPGQTDDRGSGSYGFGPADGSQPTSGGGNFEQAFADITRGFSPGDIQNSGQIQQLLAGLQARGLTGYKMGGTDAQGRTDSIVGPDGSVYRVFDSKGQWTPMKDQGGSAWGGSGGGFGSLNFDGSGGTFNAPAPFGGLSPDEFRNSPGYQFALEQGMKGIQNSAAAKGTLLTGGTLKALQGYGTGLADQTYGNAFNRALSVNQNNFGQSLAANTTNFGQGLQKHQTQYGDLYNLAALGKPS